MKTLLIAPEPTTWSSAAEALRRHGHDVVAVADGETDEGLRTSVDVPLVLLDVDAPAECGPELCRRWKAQAHAWRQVLLALTRRDEPGFLLSLLEAGADDCLTEWTDPARLEVRLAAVERSVAWRQGIARDLAERTRAEEALRKERESLRQSLDLHERDRQVLAYELHDGFAQQMTGTVFYLQSFRDTLARKPDEAWRLFDLALRTLDEAVGEIRRLIRGLRPLALDQSSVVEAVVDLVRNARRETGLEIEFVQNLNGNRLAPQLENAVYRVVQESLTNVRRHSHSQRVSVKLLHHDDMLHVEVRDWGVGFDPARVEKNHFGLEGIFQRARLLGGDAHIESETGQGTRVTVEFPWVELPAG